MLAEMPFERRQTFVDAVDRQLRNVAFGHKDYCRRLALKKILLNASRALARFGASSAHCHAVGPRKPMQGYCVHDRGLLVFFWLHRHAQSRGYRLYDPCCQAVRARLTGIAASRIDTVFWLQKAEDVDVVYERG